MTPATNEGPVVILYELTKGGVIIAAVIALRRANLERRILELRPDRLLDVHRQVGIGLALSLKGQENTRNHVLIVATVIL